MCSQCPVTVTMCDHCSHDGGGLLVAVICQTRHRTRPVTVTTVPTVTGFGLLGLESDPLVLHASLAITVVFLGLSGGAFIRFDVDAALLEAREDRPEEAARGQRKVPG